jgi:hypothetical protein
MGRAGQYVQQLKGYKAFMEDCTGRSHLIARLGATLRTA